MIIKVNNVVKGAYYDTVISTSSAKSIQRITVQNACKIKIAYSSSVSYPLKLFQPGVNVNSGTPFAEDTSNSNDKVLEVVLNVPGNWNVVIPHGLTSATILTNFTLNIFTFSDNECTNFCSGKANSRGLASGTTNVCQCNTNFIWNSVDSACIIDCASINKATSLAGGSTDSCDC